MTRAATRQGLLPIVALVLLLLPVLNGTASGAPGDKILVATFLFKETAVETVEAIVAFGSSKMPKTPPKEVRDFIISLLDEKGQELDAFGIRDPRRQYIDDGEAFKSETMLERVVIEASYTTRLPFDRRVREIRVLKGTQVLAGLILAPTIQQFCAKHEEDKDCQFIAKQSP